MENKPSAHTGLPHPSTPQSGVGTVPGVRRFFFFAPTQDRPDRTPYPHAVIALAEGLTPLGVEFYADRPYWQLTLDSDETLFRYDPEITAEDCDVVFFDRDVLKWRTELNVHAIRLRISKPLFVLVDHVDLSGHALRASAELYADFDYVLKSHSYEGMYLGGNCVPWPFGLAHRQLIECEPQTEFDARKHVMRVNFRHTPLTHAVRVSVAKRVFPLLESVLPADIQFPPEKQESAYGEMMWRQTGRRHQSSYFEDLREVQAVAAFGGWFIPNWPSVPLGVFWKGYQVMRRAGMRSSRIAQWDSWRLWEAMACGAAAIHVDFNKYGMVLPEMPKNGVHYLGVDLERPRQFVELLADEPGLLKTIASNGRTWALEHYSPEAIGVRFLALLGERVPAADASSLHSVAEVSAI